MTVPASLPPDQAAFVEPLFGALLWVGHADPQPGDVAAIVGAGTIGLLCLQLLKLKDVRVIVVEPSDLRRHVAAQLGADVVVDPRREDPLEVAIRETRPGKFFFGEGGAAVDVVMECAGKEQTLDLAMDIARMGGKVVLVALYEERTPINPNRIIHKDLKLVSSFGHATSRPFEGESAIDLLASGKVQVAPLITHRFPLDNINEAFEQQLKTDEAIKVLIEPWAR
jgi:threonine dehydrogenase-like Zn-dependent dehydrogenase